MRFLTYARQHLRGSRFVTPFVAVVVFVNKLLRSA